MRKHFCTYAIQCVCVCVCVAYVFFVYGSRPQQGRPLGFLLAWLLAPHDDRFAIDFPDRESHSQLGDIRPSSPYYLHAATAHAERTRLRLWARSLPDLAPIFEEGLEEGPPGGGEIQEPVEIP